MNIRYPIYEGVYRILTMRQGIRQHGLSNWNTPTMCVTSRTITEGIRT